MRFCATPHRRILLALTVFAHARVLRSNIRGHTLGGLFSHIPMGIFPMRIRPVLSGLALALGMAHSPAFALDLADAYAAMVQGLTRDLYSEVKRYGTVGFLKSRLV